MATMAGLVGEISRQRQRLLRISTTLVLNVVILAANMATGVITARGLDPAGRGELLSMSMWPQIVASAFTFGMPAALVYEVQRRISPPGQIYVAANLLIIGIGSVAAAAAALSIPWIVQDRSAHQIAFAQFFLLLTPVVSINLVSIAFFQGLEDFRTYNAIRVATPFLTIAFLLFVSFGFGLRPETAALSYAAAGIVSAGIALWLAFGRFEAPLLALIRCPAEVYRRLRAFGWSHAGADLLGGLEGNLDKIILVALVPASELGLYTVAYGSSRAMLAAASAVAAVEFPRAAGLPRHQALRSMSRGALATAAVALPPLLIGTLFAEPLLHIVYGAAFEHAAPLLRIFLLEGYLSGIVFVLVHAFLAAGQPSVGAKVQAVGTTLSVASLLVGVWAGGAFGAAIGLVVVAMVKVALLSGVLLAQRRTAPST